MSQLEKFFNALPRIRLRDSRAFKTAAQNVIASDLPNWKDHAIRRPEDEDEDEDEDDAWLTLHNMQRRINDLHNMHKKIQMATSGSITPSVLDGIVAGLMTKVQVFTNADLSQKLSEAASWVVASTGGAPWVALSEQLESSANKSTEWTLSIAWRHLKKKPYCVTNFNRANAYKAFYDTGIRHFAMFDDAAYSGTQKSTQIFSSARSLAAAAGIGGEAITLHVAIPFFTDKALQLFAMVAKRNDGTPLFEDDAIVFLFPGGHRVRVWTGGVRMPSLLEILQDMPDVGEYAEDVHSILFDKCGSLCIFEHKIPDYLSFPWMFGATFQRAMSDHYRWMPPYNPAAGVKPAMNSPSSPEMPKRFACFDPERS